MLLARLATFFLFCCCFARHHPCKPHGDCHWFCIVDDLVNILPPRRVLEHAAANSEVEQDKPSDSGNGSKCSEGFKFPSLGWTALQEARQKCPKITISTVVGYFIERKDGNGLLTENYRSLFGGENKVYRLFKKGHIQNIELAFQGTTVFFSAQCVPEVKTDRPYFLRVAVEAWQEGS